MAETHFYSRKADKDDWKKIKKTYRSAFPLFEQKPFFMIKSKVKSGQSHAIVFLNGEKYVGFATTLIYSDLVLLDYFAIEKSCRGCGYGSAALNEIFRIYDGKKVMLTAEDINPKASNASQREKRLQFYLKNKMTDNNYKSRAFADMQFRVLSYPGPVTPGEFMSVHYNVMGKFFTNIAGIRPIDFK